MPGRAGWSRRLAREEVIIVRMAPFRGPILVEVPSSGVRIALGRVMAEAVMVEPADAAA